MDVERVHLRHIDITAFNGDRSLIFSYVRCQFFFQRVMQFRNFAYLLYVIFSVLYMCNTPIMQGKWLFNHAYNQITNYFIYCTVDASVYFKTEYLAPDFKVFSCMLSSLASTTLFTLDIRPKMPLTYVVYICSDISLAKGHLGSSDCSVQDLRCPVYTNSHFRVCPKK